MKLIKILLISLIITSSIFAQANTVYISDKGNKYPISIQEAKERGYTACKVCKPPMN